jgi:hypothetical protein
MAWTTATRATVIVGGLTAALVVGVALGTTGVVDLTADGPEVSAEEVVYYRCPGEGPLENLHGGDRVLATGRDDTGDWVEVRSPLDPDARVWVVASAVEPDDSLDGLPEVTCSWDGPDGLAAATTVPEAPATTEPGAPEAPATTEPPAPGAPPPETTIPDGATPPPGTPPDTSDPFVGGIVAEPRDIWETGCIDPISVVRASVGDDRDPTPTVTLEWRVGTATGSTVMRQDGDLFDAEVGPFPPGTIADPSVSSLPVRLVVTARDDAGNTTVRDVSDRLTLWRCD